MSPDRYFDPESGRISAYFSKLFILIGQESLQYCILDTEKNTFVALADFRLPSSPKNPEAFYSDISQLISEEEVLQKKYPSVVIGLDTVAHTLVPAPLFDADHSKNYLEFNFGLTGDGMIRADRLEETDMYNVYSIPSGLLDVLRAHYKEAALFHRTSALIRAIYYHQKINPGPECLFLNVRDQFIDLISFDGSRLIFFNSYSCQSKEDLLYFTLYTLEQLKFGPDIVQLYISGMLDTGAEAYRLLEQYIRTISFCNSLSSLDYSPLLNQLPAHRYQEIYALALCGS